MSYKSRHLSFETWYNFLGPGNKGEISCESSSPGVDGLPLIGLWRDIIEVCVSWSKHPLPLNIGNAMSCKKESEF